VTVCRFSLDRIPQRAPEAFPLNHDLIAFVQRNAVSVTGNAAAQKMDMHVAGNPVGFEFEMMMLYLLQPECGVFLAGSNFLAPDRRTHTADCPLHCYRTRHVLEFGIQRQLRPDRARSQLSPR